MATRPSGSTTPIRRSMKPRPPDATGSFVTGSDSCWRCRPYLFNSHFWSREMGCHTADLSVVADPLCEQGLPAMKAMRSPEEPRRLHREQALLPQALGVLQRQEDYGIVVGNGDRAGRQEMGGASGRERVGKTGEV